MSSSDQWTASALTDGRITSYSFGKDNTDDLAMIAWEVE